MKRKLMSVLGLGAAVAALLVSCGNNDNGPKEYALVTDVGDIDDESFNQTSWEAVKDFASKNNKAYAYYRPTEDSEAARIDAINQAIAKGAKIIVCPGFLFETAVYNVQDKNPDVKFVLLDGTPHDADYANFKTAANTASIVYKEEIAGYLAGYGAVKEGLRDLGYCGGMAVASVQRFGTGYVQGVDAAAQELGVDAKVRYYYAGAFQATSEATAKMKTWYTEGCEAVFACGGKVYQSVVEGCHSVTGKKWIGVDVDQSSVDKGYVLTSATKGLYASVTSALEVYSTNNWSAIGGNDWTLGLNTPFGTVDAKDYVGLPTATWSFTNFTKDEYAALLKNIGNGTVAVSNDITAKPTVSAKTTVTWESEF